MRGLWRHQFRRTTLWLLLCLSLLAGLGWAHRGSPGDSLYSGLVLPFLLLSLRQRQWPSLILILIMGFSLGWWRGSIYMGRLSDYGPLYYQKITLSAQASEDAVYGRHKQLTFNADHVELAGRPLTGKIELSGFGVNAVYQGDEVAASGKLYPGFGAYQGSLSFANLSVTAHHSSLISELRRRFTAAMQTALPEPLAPFAMGLLVGQRATLPDSVKQDLLHVGLTHIIAVSGYNLTIILQASRRLLGRRSKRLSTLLTLGLMLTFLLLAGASASIIRAAIVSTLSILTTYYGRQLKPLNLICLAAAITAWANPVYIWSDLSWYLSFLAFAGVMVLAPLIKRRWPAAWQQSLLGGVALESICAELMTLPFVLHIFGQMSRIGLLANVLVVTLIPLAMLLSLIAGLAGMLIPNLCGWLSWPAVLLLNYMLDVAHSLAHLPHVFIQNVGFSLGQMLAVYACLGLVMATICYNYRDERTQQMVNNQAPEGG